MHEMHLINDLFADVLKHANENKAKKVTKLYLQMGDFTEINPDILKFHFNELAKGTAIEDAVIDIKQSDKREIRLLSFDCE
ncbi:hydrogenase maturation nickel metallochaperone HypA [Candidatus Saganbacteria bacterium]|nr:hydrogenase maturation nickel metallochaperone HypA [Candidatus Saganbacteria bacterium]